MKRMQSRITIGNLIFENQIHSVEVDHSWKNLVQTATIKMPRYTALLDPAQTDYKINTNDAVQIELGYDDEFVTEFTGYISERSPKLPLEFKCEDEMYVQKQSNITQSWRSITLRALLQYLIPNVTLTQVPDITLAPFRINQASVFRVLQDLKREYCLAIYYRNGQLFAGLPLYETGLGNEIFHFQKNVPLDSGLNLTYKTQDDIQLSVKAVSLLPNNKKLEIEVEDNNNKFKKRLSATKDVITLTFYNITSKTELQKVALAELQKYVFDGYRGTFKTFGQPFTQHGMTCDIFNDNQPERNGRYFIDGVKVTYDSAGYRRVNELGKKAA